MATNLIGRNLVSRRRRKDRLSFGTVQNSTISTLDLNDTVSIVTLTKSRILLGSGNDRLTVTGDTNEADISLGNGRNSASFSKIVLSTVRGSSGIDAITISTAENSAFLLSGGNDSVTLTGAMGSSGFNNTIDAGSGTDTLKLTNFSAKLSLSYDQGYFILNNFGQTQFKSIERLVLADGITATLSYGSQALNRGFITVNGTSGDDKLKAESTSAVTYSINAGAGNDTVDVSAFKATTIDGGTGNDSVILASEEKIYVKDGKWSIGNSTSGVALLNIESIFMPLSGGTPDNQYTLRSNGVSITSTSKTGGIFKGTTGTDTIVGTVGDDNFYIYGDLKENIGVDFFDLSAGGNDTINIDPDSYRAGTVPIRIASVFGANKNDRFGSIYAETLEVVSDTRNYNTQGIATSGSLQLQSPSTAGVTFQVDFIATKPV